jgi:hypothetical protein
MNNTSLIKNIVKKEIKKILLEFDNGRFFKKLSNLNTIEERKRAAENALGKNKNAGIGEGRVVFILNTRQVIKIAITEKGIRQNNTEYYTYSSAAAEDNTALLPKIFYKDSKFRFIVSELVRPLTKNDQALFESKTGISWEMFEYELEEYYSEMKSGNIDPSNGDTSIIRYSDNQNEESEEVKIPEFILEVLKIIQHGNLFVGDLLRIEHYGIAGDSRIVMLDTGFSGYSAF